MSNVRIANWCLPKKDRAFRSLAARTPHPEANEAVLNGGVFSDEELDRFWKELGEANRDTDYGPLGPLFIQSETVRP